MQGTVFTCPLQKNLHTLRMPRRGLLTDAQLGNDRAVTLDIFLRQIVQQTAALTDHLVHAQTAVVVVGMLLEVLRQLADTLGEDGDLDFGRAGVALMGGVVGDDVGFLFLGDHVEFTPFKVILYPATKPWAERTPQ